MKNLFYLIPIIISAATFSACNLMPSSKSKPTPTPSTLPESTASDVSPTVPKGAKLVALNTKYGQILIQLFTDEAPRTTSNFISKADSGFYNDLTFHRVEPDFVIQGGDPLGNGTGGGTIASEINNLPFERGSVGLARGNDINVSNDAQFFICLTTKACAPLTGKYVNFGTVISGMEYVDKIKIGDKINNITSKTK